MHPISRFREKLANREPKVYWREDGANHVRLTLSLGLDWVNNAMDLISRISREQGLERGGDPDITQQNWEGLVSQFKDLAWLAASAASDLSTKMRSLQDAQKRIEEILGRPTKIWQIEGLTTEEGFWVLKATGVFHIMRGKALEDAIQGLRERFDYVRYMRAIDYVG